MDEKLRALLRRYATTASDADAHAAAHAAYHSTNVENLQIWVVHSRTHHTTDIELFLTEPSATKRAAEHIKEWLRENATAVDEDQLLLCEAELATIQMILDQAAGESRATLTSLESQNIHEALSRADSYLPSWAAIYVSINPVED